MSIEDEKRAVRARLKAARDEIPAEKRVVLSALACKHLRQSDAWPTLGDVALFAPLSCEADPTALAVYAPERIAYPQVVGDDLVFRDAPACALVEVPPFGVREPTADHPRLDRFALVIVPGLGFTAGGGRIGYGRGFYDRALTALRAQTPDLVAVGFGFAAQVVDALPLGPADAPLDAVVTDAGFAWCRPRAS